MGHRPPLLPVAPLRGGWCTILSAWLPAYLVPARLAFGGLAWVRTSQVGRLCSLPSRAPGGGCELPFPSLALTPRTPGR